tara:strand:- start:3227 stop:3364 length:138 start_codon:yes stop_codon:yes gene_type:complete
VDVVGRGRHDPQTVFVPGLSDARVEIRIGARNGGIFAVGLPQLRN